MLLVIVKLDSAILKKQTKKNTKQKKTYSSERPIFLALKCYHLLITLSTGPRGAGVRYLATDVSLIADPGVASLIPARSHTLVEIDHEIISTVILIIQEEMLSVTSKSM